MTDTEKRTTCPRHPKVETALRCATCGVLICPNCLVPTPVGSKCKACASQQSSPLFKPSLGQALAAVVVGLAAGAFAGWAAEFGGFFILFFAVAYGGFVGGLIMRAAGRKRGRRMEIIAGVSMTVAALGARLIVAAAVLAAPDATHPPYGILNILIDDPIPLAAIVIAVAGAVSRIRYL